MSKKVKSDELELTMKCGDGCTGCPECTSNPNSTSDSAPAPQPVGRNATRNYSESNSLIASMGEPWESHRHENAGKRTPNMTLAEPPAEAVERDKDIEAALNDALSYIRVEQPQNAAVHIKEALKFLRAHSPVEAQTGWVSVEERLPETLGPWLVWFGPYGSREVAYWENGKGGPVKGWWDSHGDFIVDNKVTHWQPLPAAPSPSVPPAQCLGYPACDGDLEGAQHEPECPKAPPAQEEP